LRKDQRIRCRTNMTEENICPGCGRHCDLNEPHCGRGEEYRRTREMPEKRHGKEQHDRMRIAHYHAADMDDRLIINLRGLGHMMRKLDTLVSGFPDTYKLAGQDEVSKTYSFPKSYVSYRKPRAVSKEQREQARQMMIERNREKED